MALVTVVGLGPAGPELVTNQARELLQSSPSVWLRTRRHPAASLVADAPTFDDVYDNAARIEDVYGRIVDALVEAAQGQDIVYVVPGSPLVAEATVDLLRRDQRVETHVLPALSFLDLAWLRVGIDPLAASPRLVDGRRFALESAGERGPLLVAQCDAQWVLSEIKLAFENETPPEVTVLQRLGLDDEAVFTIGWEDLDRVVDADHLTSLWIPTVPSPVAFELSRVNEVAIRLRRDCPWDREQTHETLARYLLEEAYELLEAIDALAHTEDDRADVDFIEELGDLFFQVFAHAAIATEEGRFTIADIAQAISDKLIERHPHVYGSVLADSAADVMTNWEASKKASKKRTSLMEGIPKHLPALLYALKVMKKIRLTGIDVDRTQFELGDIGAALYDVVNTAVEVDIDPEAELRLAANAVRLRFERAEALALSDGIELVTAGPEIANRYWSAARE